VGRAQLAPPEHAPDPLLKRINAYLLRWLPYLARTTEPTTLSAQVWRRASHSGHR
jgi:hypothetical protein